ncbi:acetyl-CoA C-acyltransferase [Pyruvatibacter mobilis]|uniref:acetyl-CoA C-acyltransferase n=1 Tax=Pyruvatibacter mobilis TaxID=1712261 RepID=UPI003C7C501F
MSANPVIFEGARTPFGRHGGAMSRLRVDELAAAPIREVLKRSGLDGSEVEDVILGDTNQAGEDSRNVARNAALIAGLPQKVGGLTVNRLCGSGLAAVMDAGRAIRCGEGDMFIAGGVESMSRAPLVMSKATSAFDRGQQIEDSTIGWRFPNKALLQHIGNDTMPQTAENVAERIGITREESDTFAAASHQKYEAALASGFFKGEIMDLEVPAAKRKAPPEICNTDEGPRPGTTVEGISGLKPIHGDGGVVTAANASGINDGAAALIIGDEAKGKALGLTPRARLVSAAIAGVEPRVMGLGPVDASKKALDRAGLTLDQMDVLELNEAFAAQVLGCLNQMGVAYDDPRVNPHGGAIAIGHPLGASGARLALTAIRALEEQDKKYALVTMCIGIGQGIAAIFERAE